MHKASLLLPLPLMLLLLLALQCLPAAAQTASLQGMFGSKALVVIDGGAPRGMAPGDTVQGVTLLSTSGDQAVVQIGGQRRTLRVGESPASFGARGSGDKGRIAISADSGGHFMAQGAINGRSTQFLVDTGATSVAMSIADAERLGLNYKAGQPVRIGTANGEAQGWRIKLTSVRVGEVELHEIDAVVTPMPMPFVLLGNSFLSRFQMRRENDLMVLEKRF